MGKKTRRRLEGALKAKVALEALRNKATVAARGPSGRGCLHASYRGPISLQLMIGARTFSSAYGERNRWSGRRVTAGVGGTLGLVMIAVLVAGCATPAQPQYHAAISDTQSESL